MKIKLLTIGSLRDADVARITDRYAKRIPHYWPFTIVELPDVKGRAIDQQQQKELEGKRILAETAPSDFMILLDERGKQYTSRKFAELIIRKSAVLPHNLIFVVGGPYGFSRAVYDRADDMLSLSNMTFPHELARLFAVEQIYRAGTISRGEPYHHD